MWWRAPRWRGTRDTLWRLLDPLLRDGARVAVVGAGNGHDLPLRRLAGRAGELWLFDLDHDALRRARRRTRRQDRVVGTPLDVTFGAADAILAAAISGHQQLPPPPAAMPVRPGAPFDVVVGDLLYTQLLYPALADSGLPARAIDACLRRHGQRLTDQVVATLHASAPAGLVVHVHDLLGWWAGHPQPVAPDEMLALAHRDPDAALSLAANANPPLGCDPRQALRPIAAEILHTSIWLWPFSPSVDYLVSATVAAGRIPPAE